MAIEYPASLALTEEGRRYRFTDRDAMLYATAIGMGSDLPAAPGSRYEHELPFLYERDLRAMPTFASVIAWGAGVSVAKLGLDPNGVLHGATTALEDTEYLFICNGAVLFFNDDAFTSYLSWEELERMRAAQAAPAAAKAA